MTISRETLQLLIDAAEAKARGLVESAKAMTDGRFDSHPYTTATRNLAEAEGIRSVTSLLRYHAPDLEPESTSRWPQAREETGAGSKETALLRRYNDLLIRAIKAPSSGDHSDLYDESTAIWLRLKEPEPRSSPGATRTASCSASTSRPGQPGS